MYYSTSTICQDVFSQLNQIVGMYAVRGRRTDAGEMPRHPIRVLQFGLLFCFEPFAIFMAALKKLSPQGTQRSTGDIKIPTLFRKWCERRVGHPRQNLRL